LIKAETEVEYNGSPTENQKLKYQNERLKVEWNPTETNGSEKSKKKNEIKRNRN
jgi:hypothetical protein